MLAKFENGYFLEVLHLESRNEYLFTVYDEDMEFEDSGQTEYRSMEMFHPMNEIDYILQHCEPVCVKGKYELLPCEIMEDYKELFEEDPNGEWCLERQGTDYDDIRFFKTEYGARLVMLEDAEEIAENAEDSDLDDDYCEVSGQEYFQCWSIYKRKTFNNNKEKLFYDIEKEFERADRGVSQYAWELQDTSVIRDHLWKLEKLVNQLKEMM